MSTPAIYLHHERTTTAALETDLQVREIGIDPVLKMLSANSSTLGVILHAITQESPVNALVGRVNIGGAVDTSGVNLNSKSGDIAVSGGFSLVSFGVGESSNIASGNSEYVYLNHDGSNANLWVGKSGTGTYRSLLISTSGVTRYQISAAGAHTVIGAVAMSTTLTVNGTFTGGIANFSDTVSIGSASPTGTILRIDTPATTLTSSTQNGVVSLATFNSAATATMRAGYFKINSAAASYTTSNVETIRIDSPTFGSGQTVSTAYGLRISNISGGGTNYAINTGLGLVSLGDAVTMASTLSVTGTIQGSSYSSIGSAPASNNAFLIYGNVTGLAGASQLSLNSQATFTSAATTAGTAFYSKLVTSAAAFTMANGYSIYIETPLIGAGSAVTTNYGLFINNQSGGGTNYAIKTGTGLVSFGGAVSTISTITVGDQYTHTDTDHVIAGTAQTSSLVLCGGDTTQLSHGARITLAGNTNATYTSGSLLLGSGTASGSVLQMLIHTNQAGAMTIIGNTGSPTYFTYDTTTGSELATFNYNLAVTQRININAATDTANHNVNVKDGSISLSGGFNFNAFGVGTPANVGAGNTEFLSLTHGGSGHALLIIDKTGTGTYRDFILKTSNTEQLRISAAGVATFAAEVKLGSANTVSVSSSNAVDHKIKVVCNGTTLYIMASTSNA